MPSIPPIKIRGIRQSIPTGFIVGRKSPGSGDAELIPYHALAQQLVATGVVAPGVAITPTLPSGGSGSSPSADRALQLAGYAASLDTGAVEDGPPGPPGTGGAAGTPGAAGPQGAASNIPGIDGDDGQDGVPIPSTRTSMSALVFIYDGAGVAPTTNSLVDLYIPFACTILSATMQGDVSGSAVVDVWALAGTTPPTVTNTIVASAKPTLSSQIATQDTTLTGWTKSIAAGTSLRTSLNSASTLTRVTLTLAVMRAGP